MTATILERWSISAAELTDVVDRNPSLRGMLFGYVAEENLHQILLTSRYVQDIRKDDDHDRRRKGDRVVTCADTTLIVESKSLQTNTIRRLETGELAGKVQCDASDRRLVNFADGTRLNTTCLLTGEFDILVVNLFAFQDRWLFAFALNEDLPRSTYKGYTAYQQSQLLATLIPVTWPVRHPFVTDVDQLLERLLRARGCL